VLLKPRFERQTLLLWLIPPLVLFGGGAALWMYTRRRATGAPALSTSLSTEEEAKIAALMSADATVDKS
jgi:cytochrome c-type biogenesis protein CcmH